MRTQKLEAPGHCADGSDSPPKYEWRIAIGRGGLLGSRDQEPNRRDPWGVCVFITAGPSTKLFAWGGGDIGGHVLRETMSRGLCGLVCPSRTGVLEMADMRKGQVGAFSKTRRDLVFSCGVIGEETKMVNYLTNSKLLVGL